MAESADPLFLHLHKIPPSTSQETLDRILQTLWSTRKTGLGSSLKLDIQTLLPLPTPQHLDPVLACLRLIIRKCVNGDDIENLLPNDVSVDVRRSLVAVLEKYENQWTEEASRDQPLWQRTRVSHQIELNAPLALPSFPASEPLMSLWPRQDNANSYPNNSNLDSPVECFVDPRLSCPGSIPLQQDKNTAENMTIIPRLKSMTWTMENRNLTPENRVAVITLKLQDYTKSPSGEIDVKFQLSKDTLELMLNSMVDVSGQLSNTVRGTFTFIVIIGDLTSDIAVGTIIEEAQAIVAPKPPPDCVHCFADYSFQDDP